MQEFFRSIREFIGVDHGIIRHFDIFKNIQRLKDSPQHHYTDTEIRVAVHNALNLPTTDDINIEYFFELLRMKNTNKKGMETVVYSLLNALFDNDEICGKLSEAEQDMISPLIANFFAYLLNARDGYDIRLRRAHLQIDVCNDANDTLALKVLLVLLYRSKTTKKKLMHAFKSDHTLLSSVIPDHKYAKELFNTNNKLADRLEQFFVKIE